VLAVLFVVGALVAPGGWARAGAVVPALPVAQADNGAAPYYRGNAARTGGQPGPAPDGAPEVLWSYNSETYSYDQSPAVAEGLVFFAPSDLYAVDAATGEPAWTANIPGSTAPVVADGVLYVAGEGTVYALDPATGDEAWAEEVADDVIDTPPAVVDDIVYVGSRNGSVSALDAEDGDLLWTASVDGQVGYLAVADGVVFAVDVVYRTGEDPRHALHALDAEDGDELWDFSPDDGDFRAPVAADGLVFGFGLTGGLLYALDAEDGDPRWTAELEAVIRVAPAVVAGVVYAGNDAGNVYAFDAETGDEVWTVDLGGEVTGAPTVVDEIVVVGTQQGQSGNGDLHALDLDTGDEVWTVPLDGGYGFSASPAIVDGVIYLGDDPNTEGVLYALGVGGGDEADDDEASRGRTGVVGNSFVSPTYGYALTWDDTWSVSDEQYQADEDLLVLTNGLSTVVFYAAPDDTRPSACVRRLAQTIEDDPATNDIGRLRGEDGESLRGSDEGRAWGVYSLTQTGDDGTVRERANYLECRTLVPGEASLRIIHGVPLDRYFDEVAEREELLAGLELPDVADRS
jgi:outer membrane protein assembly factor BamB